MNKTYYIAVSMEMTANGPEFHLVSNEDPDVFKAEYAKMSGEVFINQTKSVHVMGEATAEPVDKNKVLDKVADAIAEVKKHRGSYISYKEAEQIFEHLRAIRSEAEK